MNEIKCPKCGTVFQIDESDYLKIVREVKDKAFIEEVSAQVKLAQATTENKWLEKIKEKELQINNLEQDLKRSKKEVEAKLYADYNKLINEKDLKIQELENKIVLQEKDLELAVEKADREKERKIDELQNELNVSKTTYALKEKTLKENYEEQLKGKDELIDYYKDFKSRLSTKMIGESLEVHCNTEFNRLRPLFKNAYFEKDNDIKTGSKGDFIFRDYDDEGTEVVSIMFEMKNEADMTSTKHRNEDFFKELDKDRKEKELMED